MAKKGEGYISKILAEIPAEGAPSEAKAPAETKPTGWEAPEIPRGAKLLEKYGECEILSLQGEVLPLYRLHIPQLTDAEKKLLKVTKERAAEEIKVNPDLTDPSALRQVFLKETLRIAGEEARKLHVPSGRVKVISELAVRDMLGYGALDPLIADDKLEDILVIGTGKPVYVFHRKYGMCQTNVVFEDDDSILYLIEKMARVVGRRIDQQVPLLDARLPDGSRVNATIPPVSLAGPTISIRKFRSDPLTVVDLLSFGTLNLEVASFLWSVVDGFGVKPANILISGGTGSGKTTTLNTLVNFCPERERIISIEDTAELQLPHKHWVRLETRPPNIEGRGEITMDDLVKNALRMRPDRLIVGEVRGPEALTMFTAMNTGHEGCMGTLHANSAAETITRLTEPPMSVPPIMIPALDLIIMQQRLHHKTKGVVRRITEVAEVTGLEAGRPQLSRIYVWDARTDELRPTNVPSRTLRIISEFSGMSLRELQQEMKQRQKILGWLLKKNIRNIQQVGEIIQRYYLEPKSVLKEVD
ncbi:MAG: CpaF family protein [Candidatus Hadarchaeales archaeon]